jgi:hypothetical protein
MLKQQLTQEDATLSVVYDAETTTHTKDVTLSMSTMPKQQHKVVTLTRVAAP